MFAGVGTRPKPAGTFDSLSRSVMLTATLALKEMLTQVGLKKKLLG